jgi:signal transduction histidine kinase
VRGRLLDVVGEVAPAIGFEPAVRFAGLVEDAVSPDLADDLVAVLREALTNIARHAHARTAEVGLKIAAEGVALEVRDNGVGFGETVRDSGLANMRHRAERHGGTLTVSDVTPSGARLCWSVPLAEV